MEQAMFSQYTTKKLPLLSCLPDFFLPAAKILIKNIFPKKWALQGL
jgi:hypothetical protein